MKAAALALALMLFSGTAAFGYAVGPPLGLEDLGNKADLIFRGTVESNTTVDDPQFPSIPGFVAQATVLSHIWVLKVQANMLPEGYRYSRPLGGEGRMKFRHYAPDPTGPGIGVYAPQSYSLDVGKSYLIFAKQPAGSAANSCQQIWMSHTGMMDEGVLLSAKESHLENGKIKDIVWDDLTKLVKSKDPNAVIYGIEHLDAFSGSHGIRYDFGRLCEYQRADVMAEVHGLITDADPSVAQAALKVVGSHNPYLSQEQALYWLATVGSAKTNLMQFPPNFVNEGGLIYWRELAAVVDGKAEDATRALAVGALGLVREPSLESSVKRWLGDKSAAVRGADVLLLADYPALASHDELTALAADADSGVRTSTAYVIGFTQNAEEAGVLVKLLSDSNDKVRQAASQSLLSFSLKDSGIEKILRNNLDNKELRPLVIVALGQQDPAGNLDLLIDETAKKTSPENWPGGQIPAFTAAHLLFDYLKAQPAADLQSGKYDKALDALEIWEPNAAVDPQFVYALELKDGLKDRAKKFRTASEKAAPYNIQFLDRADENPQQYLY